MTRFFSAVVLAGFALSGAFAQAAESLPMIHINVSGAEFNAKTLPGRPGYDFMFPSATYFDKWQAKGIKVIRVPITWERLQPVLGGPLDPTYAALIDTLLTRAESRQMAVLLDIHNYGVYRKQPVGSSAVPYAEYKKFLSLVAERWNGKAGLHGYDIMNEPNGAADANWPTSAQAGIDGVRSFDKIKPIYVEGRSWSSASQWAIQNGALLLLRDPSNNLIFSAHLYLDSDASGTYKTGPAANFDLDIGVKRAKPFVEWLARNNKKGHIGEFGIPGNDPRWTQAGTRLLEYLNKNCVPVAYWAAGSMWGTYPLSIEPNAAGDKPQWAMLAPFVSGNSSCK